MNGSKATMFALLAGMSNLGGSAFVEADALVLVVVSISLTVETLQQLITAHGWEDPCAAATRCTTAAILFSPQFLMPDAYRGACLKKRKDTAAWDLCRKFA